MKQMGVGTLRRHTAEVLAQVEAGEVVEITNRGRPVARIVPIITDSMADLVAAGMVRPPTITGPILMPTTPAEPGSEAGSAGELSLPVIAPG
jgi:prevent-host-death family protein